MRIQLTPSDQPRRGRNRVARPGRAGKKSRKEARAPEVRHAVPAPSLRQRSPRSRHNTVWIVSDVVLLQEGEQFGREIHAAMMGFLRADISDDGRQERVADAKGRVILLPRKFRTVLRHPAGRVRFDCADGFGERGVGGNFNQEVQMIGGATDRMAEDFVVVADAGDVVPEFRSERWRDARGAILGREDYVDDVLEIGMGHNELDK
jgi:hypothetical protein